MKVGEKVRKIRELKGLLQDYLATKLNISPQAYGKLEREETKLDLNRVEEIAKYLEVDPIDILTFDERQVFNNTFNNHASHQKNFILKQSPEHTEYVQLLRDEVQHLRKSNELLEYFKKGNS